MITWMQKHKKYLIATIWVSTIAFVGAGFVGWGSVDFSSKGSSVAKVGSKSISYEELNTAYGNIFNYYNQMYGGKLDAENAKKMGLQDVALQTLVQQALIENFAKEMGVVVSDEEILTKIVQMEPFQKNGVFDKALYTQKLASVHLSVKTFEEDMKKEILTSKVRALLAVGPTPLEKSTVLTTLQGADRVSVRVLNPSEVSVTVTEEMIKNAWEKEKTKYKTPALMDIEAYNYPVKPVEAKEEDIKNFYNENLSLFVESNGSTQTFDQAKQRAFYELSKRAAKKDSLKAYIEFKEGKIAGRKVEKIPLENPAFPVEVASVIATKKEGECVKPFETPQGFMMFKIVKKYPESLMSYEDAKPYVSTQLRQMLTRKAMEEKAQEIFKDFKGTDIGIVTRQDSAKFAGLTPEESQKVVGELFASKKEDVTVVLEKKFVLLKIISQHRVVTSDKKLEEVATNISQQIKGVASDTGLINILRKRYPVEIYLQSETNEAKRKG
jgi:peptidyl-prolyl cis-trans isomerase D